MMNCFLDAENPSGKMESVQKSIVLDKVESEQD